MQPFVLLMFFFTLWIFIGENLRRYIGTSNNQLAWIITIVRPYTMKEKKRLKRQQESQEIAAGGDCRYGISVSGQLGNCSFARHVGTEKSLSKKRANMFLVVVVVVQVFFQRLT